MTLWMYVAGAIDGSTVKIGKAAEPNLAARIHALDGHEHEYRLLAAVRTVDKRCESRALAYFAHARMTNLRHKQEYFHPVPELVEWVLWLRGQHFTCTDVGDAADLFPLVLPADVEPNAGRRYSRPDPDPDALFADYQARGPLAGTEWAWMPDPRDTFQDYFTPPELVAAAWQAMDGITLDAASHLLAQRQLHAAGVKIPDYYSVNRSGLDNPWVGNVWLNPPYGNNRPWVAHALEEFDSGRLEQLCWLSPAHVFITRLMRPLVERASAMVLLTPTPEFHNPGAPSKTGTNLPHIIAYWGPNGRRFRDAYPTHIRIKLDPAGE